MSNVYFICVEAPTTEKARIHLTSTVPGVNESLCKDKICTNIYMYLCEGHNPTGTQFTLRWLYNGTELGKSYTSGDDVGIPYEQNNSPYQLVLVLTQKSVQTTSVDFASHLIIQPLENNDNYMQQPFSVFCEISMNNMSHNESSLHEVEGMRLLYGSTTATSIIIWQNIDLIKSFFVKF